MSMDMEQLEQLISAPSESLSVELKSWINPDEKDGIAKIVKAALALRNGNGGYLIIGFDDRTREPVADGAPDDVDLMFSHDKIQGMISQYSSDPFEVEVKFPQRNGRKYPVIKIPPGVRTPVAAKADLRSDQRTLISANDIYVRTLAANNTPSSAKANWKDWPAIMESCFDNREADIGRFLRRHLAGLGPDFIRDMASGLLATAEPAPSAGELAWRFMGEGQERLEAILQDESITLPDFGTWEASAVINGTVPDHSANTDFLNLLSSSNPQYTGWPTWLDSRGFNDRMKPRVVNGMWEAVVMEPAIGFRPYYDFYMYDPKGRFYLFRPLEDDISTSSNRPAAMTALDFGLPVIRCAEAIAVVLAFAKAMGCDPETTSVSYAFRWNRLRGRELQSWAQPDRYISSTREAYQDEVKSTVIVPVNTPTSAIGDYVHQAIRPLYEAFNGFSLGADFFNEMSRKLFDRNLR